MAEVARIGGCGFMGIAPPHGKQRGMRSLPWFNEINVEVSTADIKPASYGIFGEITAVLGANPQLKAVVEGHADNTGARLQYGSVQSTGQGRRGLPGGQGCFPIPAFSQRIRAGSLHRRQCNQAGPLHEPNCCGATTYD